MLLYWVGLGVDFIIHPTPTLVKRTGHPIPTPLPTYNSYTRLIYTGNLCVFLLCLPKVFTILLLNYYLKKPFTKRTSANTIENSTMGFLQIDFENHSSPFPFLFF